MQGTDGSIVADTGTDPVAAQQIVEAFGTQFRWPVRTIIYTHSHPDHNWWRSHLAGNDARHHQSRAVSQDAAGRRAPGEGGDQFGIAPPAAQFINAGAGGVRRIVPPTRDGYLQPTRTFPGGEELSLTIAGVRLQLLHTPGETPDTIAVWYCRTRAC